MANKRINQLTDDTGNNIVDNDLIVVDKYISPGVYNTVFKNSNNIKSYITNLSTVSFTNINTSITNVSNSIVPTYRTDLGIAKISKVSTGLVITNSGNVQIVLVNVLPVSYNGVIADKVRIINVKIIGRTNHVPNNIIITQEYNITISYDGNVTFIGGGLTADFLYKHDTSGGNITLNVTNFTANSSDLRFNVSHTYSSNLLSITAIAVSYQL